MVKEKALKIYIAGKYALIIKNFEICKIQLDLNSLHPKLDFYLTLLFI